jgi:hypothetical protein
MVNGQIDDFGEVLEIIQEETPMADNRWKGIDRVG